MDTELKKQPFKESLTINDIEALIDFDCGINITEPIELENTENNTKKE